MNTKHSFFLAAFAVAVLAVAACHSAGDREAARSTSPNLIGKIKWYEWDRSSFESAASDSKLVFLYLNTPWCVPCAEVERESFSNDKVAAILNDEFVSIRADGDLFPNIFERYSLGGYPSCVILTPDLRLLGGTVRVPADSLLLLLERVNDTWQHTPILAENQAARLDSLFRRATSDRRAQRPSDELVRFAERAVGHHYDSTYGGFGNQPKFPLPEVNEFAFGATAPTGGPLFREQVTHTLEAQLKLLDPVWGGFYRNAAFADWSDPSHEKLTAENAQILTNYLDAFLIIRDSTYKSVAEKITAYMDNFLRTDKGWGFYNSQAGVVYRNGEPVDPGRYFAGSDSERREIGLPSLQRDIYAAANCYAVSAYLEAGRTLKRRELVDYAIGTLDSLSVYGIQQDGTIRHRIIDHGADDPLLLADQVAYVSALLDAYETTGAGKYLVDAERVTASCFSRFVDTTSGGLNQDIPSDKAIGRMAIPMKPYAVNAAAVVNYVRLYYYTANEVYRQPAENIFMYLMSVPIRNDDLRLCSLSRAYLRITRFPIKLAVIGPRGDDYNQLLETIFSRNYPRMTLTHLGDGKSEVNYGKLKFAPTDRAQLFVCGEDTLSLPITAADSVDTVIRDFQVALLKKR